MVDCPDTREARRTADTVLATLAIQLETMQADVGEIKASMKDMAQAVTKLALIEERQMQSAQSLGRAFKTLEKHEERLTVLEKTIPETKRTSDWVDRAVWALLAVLGTYAANKLGLLG